MRYSLIEGDDEAGTENTISLFMRIEDANVMKDYFDSLDHPHLYYIIIDDYNENFN